jgi:hypothetical protein
MALMVLIFMNSLGLVSDTRQRSVETIGFDKRGHYIKWSYGLVSFHGYNSIKNNTGIHRSVENPAHVQCVS